MNNYALILPWDMYAESIHQDSVDISPHFWNHIPGRFYLVIRFWIRFLYGVVSTEYEGWSQRTLIDNQPLSLVTDNKAVIWRQAKYFLRTDYPDFLCFWQIWLNKSMLMKPCRTTSSTGTSFNAKDVLKYMYILDRNEPPMLLINF